MMQDFSGLNEQLKGAQLSPIGDLAASLVEANRSRVQAVTSVAEGYARQYVMVQELTVNADGNVVDQTDESRVQVAVNTLRSAQLQLKEKRARSDALESEINTLAPTYADVRMKFKVPKAIKSWQHYDLNSMRFSIGSVSKGDVINKSVDKAVRPGYGRMFYLNPNVSSPSTEPTVRHGFISAFFPFIGRLSNISTTVEGGVIFDSIGDDDNHNGLLGRSFVLSALMPNSTTSSGFACVSESYYIPKSAFSKQIEALFTFELKTIAVAPDNEVGAFIIGAAIVRKSGVTDDEIIGVEGAKQFADTHENKIFVGSVIMRNYTGKRDMSVVLGSLAFAEANYSAALKDAISEYITQITEVPYEQNLTESFRTSCEQLLLFANSPALKQVLPGYSEIYETGTPATENYQKLMRAIIDSRWHHLVYDPTFITVSPDMQVTAFVSPWTTFVLGSPKLYIDSSLQTRMRNVTDYGSELRDYMLWFGFPGDIDIHIDQDNVSSYLPPANVDESSMVESSVAGSPELGSALAQALLLSNQAAVEELVLAM